MKKLIVIALLFSTGCASAKIKKSYDEGYAKGRNDGYQMSKADMESLGSVNEELRRKIDDCQSADKNK